VAQPTNRSSLGFETQTKKPSLDFEPQTRKPIAGFEVKPGETVSTNFEVKLEKIIAAGFEAKLAKTVQVVLRSYHSQIADLGFEAQPRNSRS
jgi:hypothetical protein